MRKKKALAVLVGSNIAKIRREKLMSQFELAEELKIGADSLSRIENGVVAPRYDRLEKIAELLNCSVGEFFFSPDDPIHLKLYHLGELIKELPSYKQDELLALFKQIANIVKK